MDLTLDQYLLTGILGTLVAILALHSYALATTGRRGSADVAGWLRWLQREPVRVRTAILALLAAAGSFGLDVSDEQQAMIVAAVWAVLGLFGEWTRAKVTPTAAPNLPGGDDGDAAG